MWKKKNLKKMAKRKYKPIEKTIEKSIDKTIEVFEFKGAKGLAISTDAPDGFKEIDLQEATQAQLEFLYKRKYPGIIKK